MCGASQPVGDINFKYLSQTLDIEDVTARVRTKMEFNWQLAKKPIFDDRGILSI